MTIEAVLVKSATLRALLRWQVGFGICGIAISAYFWREAVRPSLLAAQFAALMAHLALAAYLAFGPWELTRRRAIAMFLFEILVVTILSWEGNASMLSLGRPWATFEAQKLMVLTIAFVAPPIVWAGLCGIGIVLFAVLFQAVLFATEIRTLVVTEEPGVTLIFSGFAVAVFVLRLRYMVLMVRAYRARLEVATMKRVNRRMLAISDLCNSPLQTISLCAGLLRRQGGDAIRLDRIDRAVSHLSEVNVTIRNSGRQFPVGRYPISFDARLKLAPRVQFRRTLLRKR